MWTINHLRNVLEARGETLPDNNVIAEALLAHERFRGRTEEDYSRSRAEKELNRLLETLDHELPPARGDEYPGMGQLRVYAAARKLKLETERSAEHKAPETLIQANTDDKNAANKKRRGLFALFDRDKMQEDERER